MTRKTATSPRPLQAQEHRLRRMRDTSPVGPVPSHRAGTAPHSNATVDVGWGRLIFAQTFADPAAIVDAMREETPDRRDIAFYVRDPHVLLSKAPQELFLDPSHAYRLDLATWRPVAPRPRGFFIRRLCSLADAEAVNAIYAARGMVPVQPDFFWSRRDSRTITVFVAEDEASGEIVGAVTGIDHARAFEDPEKGASLWCLAVHPQATRPRVGELLVRRLANHFKARGAAFLDLSVMHDNESAIGLYEKLGFRRLPAFAVKCKNRINERLFTGPETDDGLNPYAGIIVDEARRRGIHVEVTDAEGGFFALSYGGRKVRCREALSEFTSGVAVSICDDKAVTRRIVGAAGVRVPEQIAADDGADLAAFLHRHGKVVVKPARGEQGRGISVGLEDADEVSLAIEAARGVCDRVLVEEWVSGQDLRLIVIDYKVVAAAVRRPARIIGDGQSTARALIAAQSRRRSAATGGESAIPLDAETERTLRAAGFGLDDVLPEGVETAVRRTANLHTGGTIHDVTGETHPALIDAAIAAARAIEIPVTGIDLMVRSPREPDYAFIEANERPGLANHEPQPTAERFLDFLFPLSRPAAIAPAPAASAHDKQDA
ncbi:N-acetylglutaminylglutamine synthetase [Limibaculum sp. M0105]|uniref:N-acetylglutaminylglutamine synthetase n=1 Tax=Thermohalobaculum xanthum TaxID=2753746 RepID=A0A8J7M8N5_9RHOB|nr:N-acetylglutaminylglutamine synthetase [Thermohalobaculum xanthum]MBK0399795.1 N-acetylglutaminylglutamine synthetase [Thermohalobaculum xanthum]